MTELLHRRIRREIEAKIHAGELVPGSRLPTENELCGQYGVSRATAQRVLNDLAAAGLAVRHRRHGTFVADVTPQINLLAFAAPEAAAKGAPGRHEILSAHTIPSGDAVVPLPDTPADTAVIELVRRKFDVRDRPRSIERHVILFSAAPGVLQENLEHFVSMRYFRARGVPIDSVRVYLDPVCLDETTARLLDSEPGTPALKRRRESRTEDGTVVEIVETIVRPGSAQFFVEVPFSAR
ncbi:GntR family transcriptional regulator [Amycolatopsis regifaucium]|uniref:GntR family transcriptional regulator n=1 Tax=Amycolatopsis regifaucium TaxID=546365 RepID=A0A154M4K1_9PSEU|nr:GntR family transcriptional regulator [Amycolatopsis regifaucium]KZB79538.1 GntR family transcriptional regulator [Amycolatopsis regifaucium]OKA07347.1 GntR family transcriptional regulator [Amycolatopsis regifaucium]SFH13749.1 transcriptional regulator, GntR family [Amycolatopsis regifaucium]